MEETKEQLAKESQREEEPSSGSKEPEKPKEETGEELKEENKSKELSKKAAQRKRKREKEKEEKQKGIDIVQEHLNKMNLGESAPTEGKTDKQLEFEKELAWCIKQLRLGVITNNVSPEQSSHPLFLVLF